MKSKSKRSSREDSRPNEIQSRSNDEKDAERRTSLHPRQPKQANAVATTIPSTTLTETAVAPQQPKRRTVVVSGPIKYFEQTKGMYDESDNVSTSTEERTKRKLLKRKGRKTRSLDKYLSFRPFHRSRVLIVIDGNLETVGSISSTSSLSGRSDDSLPDNDDPLLQSKPRARKRMSNDDGNNTKVKVSKIKKETQEPSSSSTDIQESKPDLNVALDDPMDPTAISNTLKQQTKKTDSELLDKDSNHKKISKRTKKQSSSNNKISIRAGATGDVQKDEIDEDQDPMKETDMGIGFDNDDDDDHESSQEHTENSTVPKSKLRKTLDESTLELLKSFAKEDLVKHQNNQISRYSSDRLIEEEIELFMHRQSRIAQERTQHELVLLSDEESGRAIDGASIFIECLQETEEHALWQDYFRKAVFESTRNYQDLNSSSDNTTKCLDKRTLDWLKRNVGFYQYGKSINGSSQIVSTTKSVVDNTNSIEATTRFDENSSKTKSTTGRTIATRRYTRDKVQESRKNEINKGLDVLTCAIDEIQKEYDVMNDASIVCSPRISLQKVLKSLRDNSGNRKIRINIFLQRPKNLNSINQNTKSLHSSQRVIGFNGSTPIPPLFPSLRQLDSVWRKQQPSNPNECSSENKQRKETEKDFLLRNSIDLGQHFKESGIIHRLPRWGFFIRDNKTNSENGITRSYLPNLRHSDFVLAKYCNQLMDCLKGRARLFTKCEFFYSDLDRGWYNENKFAIDAARLGVPLGSRLYKNEWRAIRRRINTKIRRFSKSFIRSQMAERNKYRNTLRMLQRNIHLSRTTSFPYDVPALIKVGTTVNAYCKKYRIVQRGTVLSFDRDSAHYMIQFENTQFGFELCPDSEVASLGRPKILLRGSHNTPRYCDEMDLSSYCSSSATTQDLGYSKSLSFMHEIERILETKQIKEAQTTKTPTAITPAKSQSFVDQVAENEAFLTLLSTIDRAKRRKREILSIIDDTNALVLRHHPSAEQQIPRLSKSARDHLNWLEANLDRTNRVLRTALNHLHTLYMTGNRTTR